MIFLGDGVLFEQLTARRSIRKGPRFVQNICKNKESCTLIKLSPSVIVLGINHHSKLPSGFGIVREDTDIQFIR